MIIKGNKVFYEGKFSACSIECEGGKIKGLTNAPADIEAEYVLPGFIDIHTHGGVSFDANDVSDEAYIKMSKYYLSKGVTSYLPTLSTNTMDNILDSVRAIKRAKESGQCENIAGIHLEGLYLCEKYRGAHTLEWLRKANIDEMSKIIEESGNLIKIVTLAPEIEGGLELIRFLASKGITASIGHSAATYEQAMDAKKAGVTHATHTYNAMSPLHHREPGVVGAIMDSDICAELICDGVHIHPAAARIMINAKAPDKVCLVSDSIRAAGMPNGEYELSGLSVTVRDGVAINEEGVLAGGTSNIPLCFKNVVSWGIDIERAVLMASENPAFEAGLKNKGKLCKGYDADFTLLDENLDLCGTVFKGEKVL